MSPQACFTAAVLAFLVDYWGVGQAAVGDRFSFFLYLAAWADGLKGSGFAGGAVHLLNQLLASASAAGKYAPIMQGAQQVGGTILAIMLVAWTFFCLVPPRYSTRLGRAANHSFRKGGGGGGDMEGMMRGGGGRGGGGGQQNHINWRLLWASVADATIAPLLLGTGLIGGLLSFVITLDTGIVGAAMTGLLAIGKGA